MYIKNVNIDTDSYINLVRKSGSVFNQPEWIKLYGSAATVCGIFNLNNELIGAFNVFKASKFGINYCIVPPYSPSNGLFFLNPASNNANKITFEKEVHQLIANYFIKINALLKISAFPVFTVDMQVYYWKNFKVIPNYTYQLNLKGTTEELFDNLTTEKRKSIRKAEKDNLEIKLCNDYNIVKQLVLKTFDRKNKSVSQSYLDKILFQFSNSTNSFAFVAYQNNKPSACTFHIFHNQTSYYLFGGYDDNNRHHGAGVSCMWRAINYAKNNGILIFDFEGSMLPEVEKYFREFGGQIIPYFTINKANYFVECLLKLKNRNRF